MTNDQRRKHLSSVLRPSSDKFLGAWLVTEYVYNPNGRFVGIIHQRRELEQLENGNIRVTQHCQPEASLAEHPMGGFTGTPVFDLQVDGRFRRYLGPAVIGTGVPWSEGVMTGSGVWPVFGHNFRSFAFLAAPNRQLTGGKFFNATEMVANIVGVAMPETETDIYPELDGPTFANECAPIWQGTYRTVLPDGEVLQEESCERRYTENGRWRDIIGEQDYLFDIQERMLGQVKDETFIGIAKRTGWMLEAELVEKNGRSLQIQEVLDGRFGHLASLRHWYRDGKLEQVEVIQLRKSDA